MSIGAPRTYSADPLRSYKFRITIDGSPGGFSIDGLGFQSISGLGTTVDVIEYREGGDPESMRKLPGLVQFDNLTLERGKYIGAQGADLLNWMRRVWDPVTGAHAEDFRAKIVITLLTTVGGTDARPACEWTVYQAWPVSYKVGDLQTSSSELLIDTVEIAYENMVQHYFDINGAVVL